MRSVSFKLNASLLIAVLNCWFLLLTGYGMKWKSRLQLILCGKSYYDFLGESKCIFRK